MGPYKRAGEYSMRHGVLNLMNKTSHLFSDSLARSLANWRERRLENDNLLRLRARDLADRGVTQEQFEFDLNLGRGDGARKEH